MIKAKRPLLPPFVGRSSPCAPVARLSLPEAAISSLKKRLARPFVALGISPNTVTAAGSFDATTVGTRNLIAAARAHRR